MDIQCKRLLLCLILSLGGLALAGCATTTSQAATVSGQVTLTPVATATPPLGVTRVSIRVSSSEIVLPVAPVSAAEAEATPTAVSPQADEYVQATAEASQRWIVDRGVQIAVEAYQAQGGIYVVRTGDNLYRIAKRYGLTVEQLAAANGIVYPYYIQIGQSLIIPPAGAPPGGGTYLVRTGDNLYRISKRYGLTVEQIAAANNIPPPYHIKVGQTLIIPGYAPPTPPLVPTWTPTPTWTPPVPPTPIPTTGPEMLLFSTDEGKFSILYPSGWRMEIKSWMGYFSFWAQEPGYPLPVLIGIASKPNGQRGSVEVLRDYQKILPNLLVTQLGQLTFSWEGEPRPFLIPAGNLGSEQYGRATSSIGTVKIRLIAVVNNRYEYMILTAAPPNLWDSKQYIMGEMIKSFRFLP